MNKQEVYDFIKSKNIWYEITEHKPVFNMDDLYSLNLPYPDSDAKNIFICDDKKQKYYLITVKGNKKVDLKEFRRKNNTRHLSLASQQDLMNILMFKPGSVTPLGILNDKELIVEFFIDEYFLTYSNIVGVHPNDNTATLWLKTNDLISIIKSHGNKVNIVQI